MSRPADSDLGDADDMTTMHVRRAVGGDLTSLDWVVSRLAPLLVAQAQWRLGTALRRYYDPEDLVSDAWAVTLPRLSTLPMRDGRISPVLLRFLSTALVNRVNNLAKKHLRRGRANIDPLSVGDSRSDFLAAIPADASGVVTAAVKREVRSQVITCIDELEAVDREILMLRGIEQRSPQTVAQLLGLTTDAVGMRFHRALKRLRERLPGSVFDDLPAG